MPPIARRLAVKNRLSIQIIPFLPLNAVFPDGYTIGTGKHFNWYTQLFRACTASGPMQVDMSFNLKLCSLCRDSGYRAFLIQSMMNGCLPGKVFVDAGPVHAESEGEKQFLKGCIEDHDTGQFRQIPYLFHITRVK